MNTSPKSKVIVACLTIGLGAIGIVFQNFTPHRSAVKHDVSNLYMNAALSTALKTHAEKKQGTDIAYNHDEADEVPTESKKRSPDSVSTTETPEGSSSTGSEE